LLRLCLVQGRLPEGLTRLPRLLLQRCTQVPKIVLSCWGGARCTPAQGRDLTMVRGTIAPALALHEARVYTFASEAC
jgi:hypothetical protein